IEPVRLSHDALRAEAAALGLTARQVDVAMMLTKRMSNREIAAALEISPHTAHHHTDVVLRKLRTRSRLDVADRLASMRWTHSDSRNTG
ncbi:MAG: response regulator transcription factor, partial [Gemmatimonadetes bacterium]|nr:response regulator transcription factor [Gemmatimonadota bacterium]